MKLDMYFQSLLNRIRNIGEIEYELYLHTNINQPLFESTLKCIFFLNNPYPNY